MTMNNAIGSLPDKISALNALDSIGENILIADKDYNIRWMNSCAVKLLSHVAPLFGLSNAEEILGVNMDQFHQQPKYQQRIMKQLSGSHRARITIKNRFVTDIVITPINDKEDQLQGYVVMLMDVTTKAEEDKEKEKLIQALSIPMITIWEKTIALPLIGKFDKERADRVNESVLKECTSNGIQYVLIDVSGLYEFENETKDELQKLNDCLRLIGTKCVIVGITPTLAMTAGDISSSILTFQTAYAGLQYIIKSQ
jgi:anti-anti-sigma regulatory factor